MTIHANDKFIWLFLEETSFIYVESSMFWNISIVKFVTFKTYFDLKWLLEMHKIERYCYSCHRCLIKRTKMSIFLEVSFCAYVWSHDIQMGLLATKRNITRSKYATVQVHCKYIFISSQGNLVRLVIFSGNCQSLQLMQCLLRANLSKSEAFD